MELNNTTLEVWLQNVKDVDFPQGKMINYFSLYDSLKQYLIRNVHTQVTIGANLKDPDIMLNDHGIEHINTVISRASYLVSCSECVLSPYEVYILLCCIQLHDVGNIFGRYNHELNMVEIMKRAGELAGRDFTESLLIRNIAEAHGGKTLEGDKDKISLLRETIPALDGKVRARVLASILRFADELADDKTRSNIFLLKEGKLPFSSEVFHAYASCLDSVHINHEEKGVELNFKVPLDFVLREFGKMEHKIFLIDEIFERIEKMHLERIYTMRFCKKTLDIEKIFVSIEFYGVQLDDPTYPPISFEVSDNGYPSNHSIYDLCPELTKDGNKINGTYIKQRIERINSVVKREA